MTRNRRQFDRLESHLPVRFGFVTADRKAFADNLSEGGLFIRTNAVLPVGSQINIEIELPQRTVQQSGEVMWAIKVPDHQKDILVCGMGIRFLQTDPGWTALFRKLRKGFAGEDG
jgi:uncharacterized protein (TIGR02266 family)